MSRVSRKLRVAWFSPLCGSSVSAWVSGILLPLLNENVALTVFHDGKRESFIFEDGKIEVDHYLNAMMRHKREPFDIFFYNLEDNADLNFARIHLALMPGIVWAHDFFMTSHGPEPILNSGWRDVVERFANPDCEWPKRGTIFPPARICAEREIALSYVRLFSNRRDLSEAKRFVPQSLAADQSRSLLLLHPVPERVFSQPINQEKNLTIGISARPQVEDHVHQVFLALQRSDFSSKVVWPVSERDSSRAQELVNEFALNDVCEIRIGRGAAAWEAILPEISIAIHLRFSAFGQPSPQLPMSLAAGIPALVTDFAAGATYPDSAIYKISPGKNEVAEIVGVLKMLSSERGISHRCLLQGYAREFHHPKVIAGYLEEIFLNERTRIAQYSQRWTRLENDAKKALIREALESRLPVLESPIEHEFQRLMREQFMALGWSGALEA